MGVMASYSRARRFSCWAEDRGRVVKERGEVTIGARQRRLAPARDWAGVQAIGPIVALALYQAAALAVSGSKAWVARTLIQPSAVSSACWRLSAPRSVPSARTTRTSVMPKKPNTVFK